MTRCHVISHGYGRMTQSHVISHGYGKDGKGHQATLIHYFYYRCRLSRWLQEQQQWPDHEMFLHSKGSRTIGCRVEDWRPSSPRRRRTGLATYTSQRPGTTSQASKNALPSLLTRSTDRTAAPEPLCAIPRCSSHPDHSHSTPPIVWWEADRKSAPVDSRAPYTPWLRATLRPLSQLSHTPVP